MELKIIRPVPKPEMKPRQKLPTLLNLLKNFPRNIPMSAEARNMSQPRKSLLLVYIKVV